MIEKDKEKGLYELEFNGVNRNVCIQIIPYSWICEQDDLTLSNLKYDTLIMDEIAIDKNDYFFDNKITNMIKYKNNLNIIGFTSNEKNNRKFLSIFHYNNMDTCNCDFKEIVNTNLEQKIQDKQKEILDNDINKKTKRKRLSIEQKTDELIETINKIKRLPKKKEKNGEGEYTFSDGTNMYNFYINLARKKDNEFLKRINNILKQYKVEKLSMSQKTTELIKVIKEIRRLPKRKLKKSDKSEYVFSDGSDMFNFYRMLLKNNNYSPYLDEINKILKEEGIYNLTYVDKTDELIKLIDNIKRLPKKKEYAFTDGTDMRIFYDTLINKKYNKLLYQKNNITYTHSNKFELYLSKIEEAIWQSYFYHLTNFYKQYNSLDITDSYIVNNCDIKLKDWLNIQRSNYSNTDKDNVQLMHELQLSTLCGNWLDNNTLNNNQEELGNSYYYKK